MNDWPTNAAGEPLTHQEIQDWYDDLRDEYSSLTTDEVVHLAALSLAIPPEQLRSILILD